jgi:hypothetical protein
MIIRQIFTLWLLCFNYRFKFVFLDHDLYDLNTLIYIRRDNCLYRFVVNLHISIASH